MTLADIDGNLIFYVIAAVIGLISWLTKKDEDAPGGPPKSPTVQRPKPAAQSEEERLRKFLEALGVPADQRPPTPVRRAAPPPIPQAQAAPPVPRAPTVVPEPLRETRKPAKQFPPPLPVQGPQRPFVPPIQPAPKPRKEYSLDEKPAPTLPVEQIHLEELQTADMPAFVTKSSQITAIPLQRSVALDEDDAYRTAPDGTAEWPADRLRKLVRSREDLRAAFLLREVLGPPRGLQAGDALSGAR